MDAKQIRQRRIGTVEIHAGGVRRQEIRPGVRIRNAILRMLLH
jgi:hypothetical protein